MAQWVKNLTDTTMEDSMRKRICICMTRSLHHTAEIDTAINQLYSNGEKVLILKTFKKQKNLTAAAAAAAVA